MLTLRRPRLFPSLALAAVAALVAAPTAAAQSTIEADGTLAVSSLGSTSDVPGSVAGSLDPLGSLAQPAYAQYVALGDSYSAFGDQAQAADDDADPADACMRSLTNYPNQLDANPAVGQLTDVTCGGALTEHILSKDQHPDVLPQIEALEADADLVTLSIGGNDVGFGEIVACITAHLPPEGPDEPQDCEAEMGETVADDIAAIFAEEGPVDDVYDAIADAAPNATVVATQYLPLMPADDEDGCVFTALVGDANVTWAREITNDINRAVDEAARRNNHVSVLPTSDTDRSGCAPADERWTDFIGGDPTNAFPMHPTTLGQEAMARAISAAI